MNKKNKPKIFFVNNFVIKITYRLTWNIVKFKRSSYKGRMVNALASGADEGRDKLR